MVIAAAYNKMTNYQCSSDKAQIRYAPAPAFCSGYSNPILNLFRSIPPMLLIVTVLNCLVIPVQSVPNSVINLGVQTLHCTGQLSTLTHDDCHGIFFSNETACFLDPFNEKYIPCAKVCNNVMRDTAGERKCKDRCQPYQNVACKWVAVIPLPREPSNAEPKNTVGLTREPIHIGDQQTHIPLIAGISTSCVAILLIIAIVLGCLHRNKLLSCCQSYYQQGKCLTRSGVQDTERHTQFLQTGSDQHESSPGQSSEELNNMESFPQSATFTAVEDQTCHSANTASTTHTESANGVQQGECYMLLPAPLIYTPNGKQVDIPAVRELLQPV